MMISEERQKLTADNYYEYYPEGQYILSNSALKVLEQSEERFLKYVKGDYGTTDSKAFFEGRLIEALAFDPDKAQEEYWIFDEEQRPDKTKGMRAKENIAWKKELEEKNEGKVSLSKEDFEEYKFIAEKLKKTSEAFIENLVNDLNDNLHVEELDNISVRYQVPILWEPSYYREGEETKGYLICKSLIDAVVFNKDEPVAIIDFKTIADIAKAKYHYKNYKYYRQLAFYTQAIYDNFGVYPEAFVLFQEKKNLYESLAVVQSSHEFARASEELEELLSKAHDCVVSEERKEKDSEDFLPTTITDIVFEI